MTPAPLTPDTLAFIRAASELRSAARIADELGWDLSQLKRVAARFRIELIAPDPTALEQAAKPLTPAQASRIGTLAVRQAPTFTADSTLEEIIEVLPLRQAQVLRILSRNMDGGFISGRDIACMMDGENISPQSVAQAVSTIRLRLAPTRWTIDSARSRAGGGYRLVTFRAAP